MTFDLKVADGADSPCGRIGGTPELTDAGWPKCRLCHAEMICYLDLKLPECDTSDFVTGSRLQVFACLEHDDIAGPIYTDYAPFERASGVLGLPSNYWDMHDGHYLLRLLPPTVETIATRQDPRLVPQPLVATLASHDEGDGLKLLGEPLWVQNPELHHCSCGAEMKLLLQVPDDYEFPMVDDAEQQPNSISDSTCLLFLGNRLYLLACTRQCHPHALWPVLQN